MKTECCRKYAAFFSGSVLAYGIIILSGIRPFLDPFLNIISAFMLLLTLLGTHYYLLYHHIHPQIKDKTCHRIVQLLAICGLISSGLGIWLYSDIETFRILFNPAAITLHSLLFPGVLIKDPNTVRSVMMTIILFTASISLTVLYRLITKKKVYSQTPSRLLKAVFLFFILSTTTFLFASDLFTIIPGYKSEIFQGGGTQQYVYNRIENSELDFMEDLETAGGFNYITWGENREKIKPYLSQTGFYGSLLKLLQTQTGIYPNRVIFFARLSISLLTALVFTSMLHWILTQYGLPAALLSWIPIVLTFWINAPTSHLMWFYFILYVPLALVFLLYPRVLHGTISFSRFLAYLTFTFLFVFLRGYTYVSNLILSAAVPVFLFEMNAGNRFRRIVSRCIQTCLAASAALFLVFLIHGIQLSLYLGTPADAATYFLDRMTLRVSGITGTSYLDIIQRWLDARFFFIGYLTQYSEPFRTFAARNNNLRNFHFLTLLPAVVIILLRPLTTAQEASSIHRTGNHRLFCLAAATLTAFLSSWTWLAAKGHMEAHYNMNGIMFMIPYAVIGFIFLGVSGQYILDAVGRLLAEKTTSPSRTGPGSCSLQPDDTPRSGSS